MVSKEEMLQEVNNMTEDELNDFAFFALKVMNTRCDIYEKLIYCMAEYITGIADKETNIKEVIGHFNTIMLSKDVEFDREDIFNGITNQ